MATPSNETWRRKYRVLVKKMKADTALLEEAAAVKRQLEDADAQIEALKAKLRSASSKAGNETRRINKLSTTLIEKDGELTKALEDLTWTKGLLESTRGMFDDAMEKVELLEKGAQEAAAARLWAQNLETELDFYKGRHLATARWRAALEIGITKLQQLAVHIRRDQRELSKPLANTPAAVAARAKMERRLFNRCLREITAWDADFRKNSTPTPVSTTEEAGL